MSWLRGPVNNTPLKEQRTDWEQVQESDKESVRDGQKKGVFGSGLGERTGAGERTPYPPHQLKEEVFVRCRVIGRRSRIEGAKRW